jgi:hypothetical protein
VNKVFVTVLACAAILFPVRGEQLTFIDEEVTWSGMVSVSPLANDIGAYADGNAYLRFETVSKPSTVDVGVQLCFWRGGDETCSWYDKCMINNPITYYCDLGTPSGWWVKSSGAGWTGWDAVRVMLRCADGCIFATGFHDVTGHVPIVFKATLVLVAAGDRLVPPAGWECPEEWDCAGSAARLTAPGAVQPSSGVSARTVGNGLVEVSLPAEFAGPASQIAILDSRGVLVARINAAGRATVMWDARNSAGRAVAPGMYFVRSNSAYASRSERLVLTK